MADDSDLSQLKFRTRAIHVGSQPDPATGAVVPPIHVASTFVQAEAGKWGEFDYSRSGTPTRTQVQQTFASLEGGCGCLAYSSGISAVHGALMLLNAGDHVVAGSDIYGGTYRLLHKIVNRAGITVSLAPTHDLDAFTAALRPNTRMVWLESPGNPLMSITDLRACAEIAHHHGAFVAVDNTFATPVFTRPLELGADIVMHSATKYLGGHSDLLGGVLVVGDEQLYKELYYIQNATGAVLGPWECFLLARGLKTLELRVREQSRTAAWLAEELRKHPGVSRVLYPGLPDHPGHDIACRQMEGGFGAMLSFEVQADIQQTKRLVESTKLFHLAVSLGAVESLIEQPALMSHASYDAADRAKHGITDSLIRLSVGLEDRDDLWQDLSEAIKTL